MNQFNYKAKNGPSDIITGHVTALTREEAIQKIMRLGHTPIDVEVSQSTKETASVKDVPLPWKRVGLKEVAHFTRQMSDMLDAGVPLLRALDLMSRRLTHAQLKDVVGQIYHAVRDGDSFSNALEQHPHVFSSLYVHMIRSGEMSGQLVIVLERLAQFLDKEVQVRVQVRSSLVYPAFIFLTGVVSVFILMTFVLPRLTVLFDDFDVTLPLATVIVMNTSYFMAQFWWLMLIGVAGVGAYAYRWLQQPQGQRWLDETILRIPFLSRFVKQVELGRFARTMATLIDGGVSLVPALESLGAVINNRMLSDQINAVAEEVKNGVSLSQSISTTDFDTDLSSTMIAVGEESGNLSKAFYKLADACERETNEWMQTFISLLGPIILVLIVGVVGIIIVAMLLPIFKMNLIVS